MNGMTEKENLSAWKNRLLNEIHETEVQIQKLQTDIPSKREQVEAIDNLLMVLNGGKSTKPEVGTGIRRRVVSYGGGVNKSALIRELAVPYISTKVTPGERIQSGEIMKLITQERGVKVSSSQVGDVLRKLSASPDSDVERVPDNGYFKKGTVNTAPDSNLAWSNDPKITGGAKVIVADEPAK